MHVCTLRLAFTQHACARPPQGLFKGMFNNYDVWNEVLHERRYMEECYLGEDFLR